MRLPMSLALAAACGCLLTTTDATPTPPPAPQPPAPPLPPMPPAWPEQFTVQMEQTMPTFPAPSMPGRAHTTLHYDHKNLRQRLDLNLFAPAPPAPISQASILANGTLFMVDLTAKNCTAVHVGVPPPSPTWFVDGSTNLGREWVRQGPGEYVEAVHLQKWGDPSFGATPFDLYARIGGDGYPVRLVTPYALPPNYPNVFEWQPVQPGAPDPSLFVVPSGITCTPPVALADADTGRRRPQQEGQQQQQHRDRACAALRSDFGATALALLLPHRPNLVEELCA